MPARNPAKSAVSPDDIAPLPASTNLPATPATLADLAASRTAIEALRAGGETRLDDIEAKLNALITSLKR